MFHLIFPSARLPQKSGFTFIEVIVTVAILATLLGAIFVALDPIRRIHQSRNAKRMEDIRAIADAIALKTSDTQRRVKFSSVVNRQWRMLGKATLPALNNDVNRDSVPGDANRNLSIDAADYTLWAANFGKKNAGDYRDCLTTCGDLGGSTSAVHLENGATLSVEDSYVNLASNEQPTFDLGSSSLSLWVQVHGDASSAIPIVKKGNLSIEYVPTAKLIKLEAFRSGGNFRQLFVRADALSDGHYHHLVFVFTSEPTANVFIDGTQPLPSPSSFALPQDNEDPLPLIFGGGAEPSVSLDIDDIRFYKAELGIDQVGTIMKGGQLDAGYPLWAYWMLDEGTGSESENSADILPERKAKLLGGASWSTDVPSVTYQTMATCTDLGADLSGYLPHMPVAPSAGEDVPPSDQATYYAVRIADGAAQLRSCNSEGIEVGGTGTPPLIEMSR
jgi:prepilin-type N-terminal cleavage/methylation domain-containing protein